MRPWQDRSFQARDAEATCHENKTRGVNKMAFLRFGPVNVLLVGGHPVGKPCPKQHDIGCARKAKSGKHCTASPFPAGQSLHGLPESYAGLAESQTLPVPAFNFSSLGSTMQSARLVQSGWPK